MDQGMANISIAARPIKSHKTGLVHDHDIVMPFRILTIMVAQTSTVAGQRNVVMKMSTMAP